MKKNEKKNKMSENINQSENIFFIGIGGASNSGKTTLGRKLVEYFQSPIDLITLDRFFLPWSKLPRHKKYRFNMEIPEALNFDAFHKSIKDIKEKLESYPNSSSIRKNGLLQKCNCKIDKTIKKKKTFIFVEGYLLFYIKKITDEFNLTFFLDCEHQTCKQRRIKRDKIDPNYFDEMVWKYYLKFKDIQIKNSNPIFLNGEDSTDKNLKKIVDIIIKKKF